MATRHLLFTLIILLLVSCSTSAPDGLGVLEGKLLECPSSPNCVSTMAPADDEEHYMEAIPYEDLQEARIKLMDVLMETPRTKILTQNRTYLHVTFTTPIIRFVDDVEFYFDEEEKLLHFRSASRVGYSDLGANRRRMKNFKKAYLK